MAACQDKILAPQDPVDLTCKAGDALLPYSLGYKPLKKYLQSTDATKVCYYVIVEL